MTVTTHEYSAAVFGTGSVSNSAFPMNIGSIHDGFFELVTPAFL